MDAGGERQAIQDELRHSQKQLRRPTVELSLAEARERREIASELHDHIGQALALVSQKLGVIQGNAIFSGMDGEFAQTLSLLDQTIRYTRDLTVEISPPVLYDLGLPAAVDRQARRAQEQYGLRVFTTQRGAPADVPDHVKVVTFKAIQELLRNVARHARASRVDITLTWGPRDLEVVVADDGWRFDPGQFSGSASADSCFGLFSIRERLSYIGGTLIVESAQGRGTRTAMTLPHAPGEATGDA